MLGLVLGLVLGWCVLLDSAQHCAVLNLEKCDTTDRVSRASNQPHLHHASTAAQDLYLG